MDNDMGHWLVSSDAGDMPANVFGFVYEIINRTTGRRYIGKKQIYSYTFKREPGKVRRTKTVKESKWREYTSSSKQVNSEVKSQGKDNFEFLILEWCLTRAELTYSEVELQWKRDVLSRDTIATGERKYYNEMIGAIKFVAPIFHKDSTRMKMRMSSLGMLNSNFQGMVVAKCLKTGKEVGMFGTEDIRRNGFTPSEVTRCIQGKHKQHKGYTFKRLDSCN